MKDGTEQAATNARQPYEGRSHHASPAANTAPEAPQNVTVTMKQPRFFAGKNSENKTQPAYSLEPLLVHHRNLIGMAFRWQTVTLHEELQQETRTDSHNETSPGRIQSTDPPLKNHKNIGFLRIP